MLIYLKNIYLYNYKYACKYIIEKKREIFKKKTRKVRIIIIII